MMKRRVVVTGLGVLTSNADGVEDFLNALREGRSGIREISQFDVTAFNCRIGGEVRSLPFEEESPEAQDRASILAVRSAELALADAGLAPAVLPFGALGLVLGTTCGGVLSLEKVSEALESGRDMQGVPDWRVQEMGFSAPTNRVARQVGITGPVLTATIACASGAHAVGMATDLLRSSKAQVMLAGGVDVVSRFIFRGFAALNGLGAPPYRAFDLNRAGVVLGEGAAMLVLEDLEHAQSRGARVYAEVLGHSFNNDGCHIVNPNPAGEGIARSLRMALRESGLTPEAVDHFNAHGTGTEANDTAETAGLKSVFGSLTDDLPVASIKPMTGHTSGGAGAVELAASALSITHGFVPPTIEFSTPDPACSLNVSAERRDMPLKTVLSANSGFGGSNAAVVLRQLEDTSPLPSRDAEEVVITGVGLLLPQASDLDTFWKQLQLEPMGTPSPLGWEIAPFDFFARAHLAPTKDSRRMDLFSQYAALAALEALRDAGQTGVEPDEGLGLVLGSAFACLESNEKYAAGLSKAKVNPVIYQNTVSNASSGYLSMLLGIRGPVSVLNQGWVSSTAAMAYGYELIRDGRSARVLAGGAERLCRLGRLALERDGILPRGSAPALQDLPTEGAGFVVLEAASVARARGARILGRVTGYGMASAGGYPAARAVEAAAGTALRTLPSRPAALQILGTRTEATSMGQAEQSGLLASLGALGWEATFGSVKGSMGDPMGAGGVISMIAGLEASRRQQRLPRQFDLRATEPRPSAWEKDTSAPPLDALLISSLDIQGSCVVLAVTPAGTA